MDCGSRSAPGREWSNGLCATQERSEPRTDALEEVDSLLGRIEHVYVECGRSELQVKQATAELHRLVRSDFDSDAQQN